MAKASIDIGRRAFYEVLRIFPTLAEARKKLNITSKQLLYDWETGCAPGAKYLQRLHYCGADIIYILTGVRQR